MSCPGFRRLPFIGLLCMVIGGPLTAAAQTLVPLHTFTSSPNSLLQSADGNFYGTSGSGANPTFFRMTPAGVMTVLHTFTSAEAPQGNLFQAADGTFYGVTRPVFDGFTRQHSSRVFRLTTTGTYTLLSTPFSFRAVLGVEASDGNIYGTESVSSCGAFTCIVFGYYAFRMTPAGAVTHVHTFGQQLGPSAAGLSLDIEASDGNLYGTAFNAGRFVIYRMTLAGTFSELYAFPAIVSRPLGTIRVEGADGNFYGTTASEASGDLGAIFRLTPAGVFTILHPFTGGASDGALPAALVQGSDGNFYGTTTRGGPADLGTVFKMTPEGTTTLLHTFDSSEGTPQSFLQALDGTFYGTTATMAWSLAGPPAPGVSPDAPAGLTATTPIAGSPRVALAWSPAAGATSYTVKRGTASGAEATIATGLQHPRWTDLFVTPGTLYYYVVSAVNGHGESPDSNEVNARVLARGGDYNGDGVTDLLVYRPSTGAWYNRDTGLVTTLGQDGDLPLPGDYDGDGVNDLAVFRPSTGNWIILASSTGTQQTMAFGNAIDVAVPADYDGDGTIDLALYRPSTGIWFIRQSSTNTIVTRALGVGADIPVPADYDGDHLVDVAVYRPASGMWYIRKSAIGGSTPVLTFQWGVTGDRPVPGDYDGDGLSDVAVFRPSSGEWHVRQSATETLATRGLGTATDLTVPADYNADGRTDIAVYRPSTGRWFVRDLTTGFGLEQYNAQWGLPGDIPPVNAAIRHAMIVIPGLPAVSTVANLIRGGDFDADGRGDISVYRPSTGAWYNLLSQTGYTAFTATAFGASSDTPVPGDYDGDGKSDLAVYTPSTGDWSFAFSAGGVAQYRWGADGDVPVPADYDGDGRTDLAIFRPAEGGWYLVRSSTGSTTYAFVQWGLNGDVPVPADYDGDGVTDLAVFRPATGVWYILKSSSGFTTSAEYQWGLNGDVPVPGEYDGDTRTDLAVFRPANGTWYILKSSSDFTASAEYQWGLSGDVPVPSDYDGDGRTDAAIYRPSNATWFLLKSTTGFTASSSYQWGLPGDVPIFKRP